MDVTRKRSNLIDFTTPVDGLAVPWSLAQIVFVYDSARLRNPAELPRSAPAMLDWARSHPGRLTHPKVSNFLGSTFLKQALVDLIADPAVLQVAATDASFAQVTAPLWAWYDQLKPTLWRQGQQFPDNGSAQRQLLNDGEIDITLSFHPAEAAASVERGPVAGHGALLHVSQGHHRQHELRRDSVQRGPQGRRAGGRPTSSSTRRHRRVRRTSSTSAT